MVDRASERLPSGPHAPARTGRRTGSARPRAILFDLDDTLIASHADPDAAWLDAVGCVAGRLGPFDAADVAAALSAASRAFWSDPADHRHWRFRVEEARIQVVARTFAELSRHGRPAPGAQVQLELAGHFSRIRNDRMRLFPGAHAVIDHFSERGVRLGLLTNGPGPEQRAKVDRFDLAHRFDLVQIEGDQGFGKPDDRAYRRALGALGVEPHEAWMVGDHLEWDVLGPQRNGMLGIWYDGHAAGLPDGARVVPDRIIRSLSELIEADDPRSAVCGVPTGPMSDGGSFKCPPWRGSSDSDVMHGEPRM